MQLGSLLLERAGVASVATWDGQSAGAWSSWGCCNKVPQSRGLKQQRSILSQCSRLDVQNQDVVRVGSFWKL